MDSAMPSRRENTEQTEITEQMEFLQFFSVRSVISVCSVFAYSLHNRHTTVKCEATSFFCLTFFCLIFSDGSAEDKFPALPIPLSLVVNFQLCDSVRASAG